MNYKIRPDVTLEQILEKIEITILLDLPSSDGYTYTLQKDLSGLLSAIKFLEDLKTDLVSTSLN